MKKVSFTVLMCTYSKDNPYLLSDAIKSVFNNSIKPDYFILTIDGPIPKLNKKIINKIRKLYPIKIIINQENIGLALSLNKALKFVKTDWIARADSDDINLPDRFAKQLKFARKDFDVIGSNILEKDKNKNHPILTKIMPITDKEIKKYAITRNPINHMTAFIKTSIIKSVGGYPDIYKREDYGLWAKLIHQKANFYNIDEILVHVNGGKSLYKRRGGFKNAYAELKLQKFLYKYEIKPFYLLILHLLFRTSLLLLPSKILEVIYLSKLRKIYKT